MRLKRVTYVTVGAKDTKTQEVTESLLNQRPLLIRPKVCLQHMLQHSRILELNNSSQFRNREGPSGAIFLVQALVLLRDLVARCEGHEDHVSDERVTPGSLEIWSRPDAIRGVAILENDGEDVDDEGAGEVLSGELLEDLFECWRCI